VDVTGYFFPGYPDAPADAYLFRLKRNAHRLGLEITGTGVRNDFTAADKAVREEGVARIRTWIEVAAKLGAPVIRVFADSQAPYKSWQEAAGGAARAEVEGWMAGAIRTCADLGAKHGILIGVQNHGDFIRSGAEHLALLDRVNHEWCGAIVDTGKYLTDDPYADIALVAPRAVNWQIKETMGSSLASPRVDLKRLVEIIRASGYRGHLPVETLAMGRKDYDPFREATALLAELRAALEQTAGRP
jgi:sugar phosphate isomerase/epimerase